VSAVTQVCCCLLSHVRDQRWRFDGWVTDNLGRNPAEPQTQILTLQHHARLERHLDSVQSQPTALALPRVLSIRLVVASARSQSGGHGSWLPAGSHGFRFTAGHAVIPKGFCAHNVQRFVTGNQKLAGVEQGPLTGVECGEVFQEGGWRWWGHNGCHGQWRPAGEEGAFSLSCLHWNSTC